PNTDGFPPGKTAILFRYDQDQGGFVQDSARAAVSADGLRIETEQGAIKTTTYYFATVARDLTTPPDLTTVTGRVFEKDGKTPVARALARFKGQEALTDGAGSYVLRNIVVKKDEVVSVEVSAVRPNGRVDRVMSDGVVAVLGGTTKAPDVILKTNENRPPTIIGPPKLEIAEGETREERIVVTD